MANPFAARSLLVAGACVGLLAMAAPVTAQDRMDKPVRILVGFAPGGTADLIARVVADKLKDTIGQPVVVENRPGAAGRIAADAVKAAAPDGATIMVMPIGPMAVVPHTLKAIPFDPVKDFTAIGLGATFQFAFAAGPGSGAKTWNEFVVWAKANPAKAIVCDVSGRKPAAFHRRAAVARYGRRHGARRRTRARPRTSTI